MKKLTRKQALELLKKYEIPAGCIKHCLEVEKKALKIADQLIKNGVELDKEFLSVAALLHDIGRYKIAIEKGVSKELLGLHAPEGQLLLEKLGHPQLAAIAGGHFLIDVSEKEAQGLGWPVATKLPDSLEAKIISIADKMRKEGTAEKELKTILDRKDLAERYWDKCSGLKEKVKEKAMAIVKELRDLGWDGRA